MHYPKSSSHYTVALRSHLLLLLLLLLLLQRPT